jgi:hypothetical protein
MAMTDKIVLTLPMLLAVANYEFKRLPKYVHGYAISGLSDADRTFRLEITTSAAVTLDAFQYLDFAQSLYDRYLLKH